MNIVASARASRSRPPSRNCAPRSISFSTKFWSTRLTRACARTVSHYSKRYCGNSPHSRFFRNRYQFHRRSKSNEQRQVYSFGGGTADGDGSMKEVLGGKGAGLAEMSRAAVPVPPGFTVSTDVCNIYFHNKQVVPAESKKQIATRAPPTWRRNSARSWAMPPIRFCSACAPAPGSPCRA